MFVIRSYLRDGSDSPSRWLAGVNGGQQTVKLRNLSFLRLDRVENLLVDRI
jgi:hypothetical protein